MAPTIDTQESSARLLKVYGLYRLILAALMLFLALTDLLPFIGEQIRTPALLILEIWLAFSLVNILTYLIPHWNRVALEVIGLVADIVILAALSYYSGGIETGLVFLIIPSVASAGLCLPKNAAMSVAAVGVTAILGTQSIQFYQQGVDPTQSVRSALLGILFFIVTALMLFVRASLSKAERVAAESRDRAEQLSLLNQTVLQRMLSGIITLNRGGDFVLINPAAEKMLGITPANSNKSMQLSFHQTLQRAYKRWQANPNLVSLPFTDVRSNLSLQPVFRHIATEPDYLDLIFLEDAETINRQAQEMKILSLEKISTGVAHEIRNPLSAISQANELLKLSESITEEDSKLIDIIDRHCERMNSIIDTIYMMSRRLEPQQHPIALRDWLADFIREYLETKAEDAQIDISLVDESIQILFDEGHLRQVLTNLFDNGLRYSERRTGQGQMSLSTADRSAKNFAILDIRDSGAGIKPENIPKIFDPFFTTESSGGTGLGLYMSKELCQSNSASLVYVHKAGEPPEYGFFRISFSDSNKVLSR